MNFWLMLVALGVAGLVGCGALMYILRLASRRTDALRRAGDHKSADAIDQMRFGNPAALPMHDRAFDRPR